MNKRRRFKAKRLRYVRRLRLELTFYNSMQHRRAVLIRMRKAGLTL